MSWRRKTKPWRGAVTLGRASSDTQLGPHAWPLTGSGHWQVTGVRGETLAGPDAVPLERLARDCLADVQSSPFWPKQLDPQRALASRPAQSHSS